jgi:hypothetical protein
MKHLLRSPRTGRFISRSTATTNIVNGRLYGYKGAIVRARKQTNNGLRLVSFHKKLNGFVRDEELEVVEPSKVREYLARA